MSDRKRIAIVRVRGRTGIAPDVEETMRLLGLTRVNHCVVTENTPQVRGMLEKCRSYVTWGELDPGTFAELLGRRGRLSGDRRVTEATLKAAGFESIDAFAQKFIGFEAELGSIAELKKVFRLHPPKKGYGSIKKPYPRGALGNRGAEIGELLRRMM